jgi:hypothetical protein
MTEVEGDENEEDQEQKMWKMIHTVLKYLGSIDQ